MGTGRIRLSLTVLLCAALGACATVHFPGEPPRLLFHDEAFAAPAERYDARQVFALSEPMRRFLTVDIAHQLHSMGAAKGLVEALYKEGQLKLEYDAAMTRNASEAFDARMGNCLSLVIMTSAFAKELGLQVEYHAARTDEIWSRSGGLLLGSGHVNVTFGASRVDIGTGGVFQRALTVDFLPSDEITGLPTQEIPEQTIVAMYMNNKAVEALVRGDLDDAYGWARGAIRANPEFVNSYNTLGLIYLRHGDTEQAERVLAYGLDHVPDNATLMSNLADVLGRLGRDSEASAVRSRLARIDSRPPYYYFDLGMAAMRDNDFRAARSLFAREVARADYNHEFHYWLGVAYFKLGDTTRARRQLLLALERSPTRTEHDLYAAKLAWLQAVARGPDAPDAGSAPAH